VEDIGTADIAALLRKVQDETPVQANRVRAVLSKMFNRAEVWEFRPVGTNPVRVQDREPERKRERNLTDAEIRALGEALRALETPEQGVEALSPHVLAAIRLALQTGMRKGELLALKWEWVDLGEKVVRLPSESHKTGAKTGRDRVVLLCEAACALIKDLPQKLGNPYVIVGRGSGALVNLQDPWEVVRSKAGLDAVQVWMKAHAKDWKAATSLQRREIEKKLDERQVRFHDLRRTFASLATRMGYPELWIAALLGHAAGSVTAGYARTGMDDDPLREGLEAIGKRMAGLLDGSIDPLEKSGSNPVRRSAS
jgi:integrase